LFNLEDCQLVGSHKHDYILNMHPPQKPLPLTDAVIYKHPCNLFPSLYSFLTPLIPLSVDFAHGRWTDESYALNPSNYD